MLLTIATVMVGALYLLSYNVIYNEGEVIQGLFKLSVLLTAGCVLIGFYRRKVAVWCIVLFGGCLLLWQAKQLRNWAILHEEVVGMIAYAEESKARTGRYPGTLEHYQFKNEWVKSHIAGFETNETSGLKISYFMNNIGITYWYSSKTGFGYYPD